MSLLESPSIISILAIVLGPAIGVLTALGAIWLKEVFDRRRAVQLWFEQTYVEDGIDRLVWYLKTFEIYLYKLMADSNFPQVEGMAWTPHINLDIVDKLPIDVLIRVETLLGTNAFTAITANLYDHLVLTMNIDSSKRSKALISDKLGIIQNACSALLDIRRELLARRPTKKTQMYDIQFDPSVMSRIASFKTAVDRWAERANTREQLISRGL